MARRRKRCLKWTRTRQIFVWVRPTIISIILLWYDMWICIKSTGYLKKLSFTELCICRFCRLDFPLAMVPPSLKLFFRRFLQGSSILNSCLGEISPTASNLDNDFWAENDHLRGFELGPNILTKIGCCGAKFSLIRFAWSHLVSIRNDQKKTISYTRGHIRFTFSSSCLYCLCRPCIYAWWFWGQPHMKQSVALNTDNVTWKCVVSHRVLVPSFFTGTQKAVCVNCLVFGLWSLMMVAGGCAPDRWRGGALGPGGTYHLLHPLHHCLHDSRSLSSQVS